MSSGNDDPTMHDFKRIKRTEQAVARTRAIGPALCAMNTNTYRYSASMMSAWPKIFASGGPGDELFVTGLLWNIFDIEESDRIKKFCFHERIGATTITVGGVSADNFAKVAEDSYIRALSTNPAVSRIPPSPGDIFNQRFLVNNPTPGIHNVIFSAEGLESIVSNDKSPLYGAENLRFAPHSLSITSAQIGMPSEKSIFEFISPEPGVIGAVFILGGVYCGGRVNVSYHVKCLHTITISNECKNDYCVIVIPLNTFIVFNPICSGNRVIARINIHGDFDPATSIPNLLCKKIDTILSVYPCVGIVLHHEAATPEFLRPSTVLGAAFNRRIRATFENSEYVQLIWVSRESPSPASIAGTFEFTISSLDPLHFDRYKNAVFFSYGRPPRESAMISFSETHQAFLVDVLIIHAKK